MQFGVIFTVDVPYDTDIESYSVASLLPYMEDEWEQTEDDREYQYGYLGGIWEGGQHRKWCACLSREQFDRFVHAYGLGAEDIGTGGAMGMPSPDGSAWFSCSPAISFISDCPYAIIDAYVTPYPETVRKEKPFDDRDWERIRRAVIRQYE